MGGEYQPHSHTHTCGLPSTGITNTDTERDRDYIPSSPAAVATTTCLPFLTRRMQERDRETQRYHNVAPALGQLQPRWQLREAVKVTQGPSPTALYSMTFPDGLHTCMSSHNLHIHPHTSH